MTHRGAGSEAVAPLAIVMPLAEQRGGAEMMLVRLLQANRGGPELDYHVAFLEDGPMVREVEALGYTTRVFEAGRLRDAAAYVRTVQALAGWVRMIEARAVLSWMPKAHFYAGPAAWARRVPAFWFQHTIPSNRWRDRAVARVPAARVLCCSEAAARAQALQRPRRPTTVIYPGVDLASIRPDARRPDEVRGRLGLPLDRPIIGMAARLQRWKGVHVFVEAARRVRVAHPEAFFVVVGGAHALEADYPEALRRQASEAGLDGHLAFVGFQANVPEWFQAMDIVVHASTEPEPFGMVLIEAMAQGKPVVATGSGGPVEIVTEGEDGRLVPPGDAGALADVLVSLLETPEGRAAMGTAARQRAQRFSTDRLASEVAACLLSVNGNGR